MSNAGRPRKPKHLKVLDGDRKDRINTAEPVPAASEVAPPYQLSDDVQAVWDRVAPDRIAKGVLTAWDVDAFAAFCEALVVLQDAPKEARNPSKPGAPSPMSKFKDAVSVCSTLGGRFGWTPSDRQKLVVQEGRREPGDDLLTG